jgi:teichuronic acid biosynthesis glycosyltransferase TuaC
VRVLVVTAMYPRAGAPTLGVFVREQVNSLRRLGLDVDVLDLGTGRGLLKYARGCWGVFTHTLRRHYDVIHAHYGLAGFVARCQWRSPVVVTFHGSDINRRDHRRLSRLVVALADEVIVVSRVLGPLVARPEAEVIPCGVDLRLFRPLPRKDAREKLGLHGEGPIVLFPSSPAQSIKRFDRFQEAITLVPEPVTVLTLEGVHHNCVPLYLNAADCVVLTSDSEGSPVVVREALACNAPVVSVDVGDVRQWLSGVWPGAVVPNGPLELAKAVTAVLQSGARSNGRERVGCVDERVIAQRVLHVYERTLPAPSRGGTARKR